MKNQMRIPFFVGALLMAGSVSFAQTDSQSSAATTSNPNTSSSASSSQPQSDKMASSRKASNAIAKAKLTDVVKFKKGDTTLSQQDKQSLRKFIDNARAQGDIDTIHVVSWADQPFPKGQKDELSDAQKDLAQKRSDAISSFLKDELKASDVETYSMAEKSNWFARAFDTNEAELKSLFSQQGAPSIEPQEFRLVKGQGGPMKSVVVIERKKSSKTKTQPATGSSTMDTTTGSGQAQ